MTRARCPPCIVPACPGPFFSGYIRDKHLVICWFNCCNMILIFWAGFAKEEFPPTQLVSGCFWFISSMGTKAGIYIYHHLSTIISIISHLEIWNVIYHASDFVLCLSWNLLSSLEDDLQPRRNEIQQIEIKQQPLDTYLYIDDFPVFWFLVSFNIKSHDIIFHHIKSGIT